MGSFFAKILASQFVQYFLSKKKIIAFVSGAILSLLAGLLGMKSQEFKDAVCSGVVPPAVEQPAEDHQ